MSGDHVLHLLYVKGTRAASRLQAPMEKWIFPILLFLWPFANVAEGIDLSDTTYSLTNFIYLRDGMWFFATFLANRIGTLLTLLPGGSGLLAMNIKCALLMSLVVLACYYTLQHLMPGWMIFLGEMIAISLYWGPVVILYNLLTYLFLTLAVLCLFLAVTGVPRKKRWYFLAGLMLGLNLFVRFSNAAQVVLILAVWFEEKISRRKAADVLRDTGLCLGGYLTAVAAMFAWIAAGYGAGHYLEEIMKLFSIGGGYTLKDMVLSTWNAYWTSTKWFMILGACTLIGVMFFIMPLYGVATWFKRFLYLCGILILIRFFWGRGMFTVNYQDYWCMFQWGMLFILVTLILCTITGIGKFRASTDERFLAVLSILMILTAPLGSNNYTFPIMMDLFVIAPFTLWTFRRIWQETRHQEPHFAWHSMVMAIFAMTLLQGALFHANFSFRDGVDGEKRTWQVNGNEVLASVRTVPENAMELEALGSFLADRGLAGRPVLTLGDIPGISYIYGMPPAISTAWADLDSYALDDFAAELKDLDSDPVVILRYDASHIYTDEAGAYLPLPVYDKARLLFAYLKDQGYEKALDAGAYTVYLK